MQGEWWGENRGTLQETLLTDPQEQKTLGWA